MKGSVVRTMRAEERKILSEASVRMVTLSKKLARIKPVQVSHAAIQSVNQSVKR